MKKSIIIPSLLLVYFGVIASIFANDWIKSGHLIPFIIICVAEAGVIIATFFAIRRKERIATKREDSSKKNHSES